MRRYRRRLPWMMAGAGQEEDEIAGEIRHAAASLWQAAPLLLPSEALGGQNARQAAYAKWWYAGQVTLKKEKTQARRYRRDGVCVNELFESRYCRRQMAFTLFDGEQPLMFGQSALVWFGHWFDGRGAYDKSQIRQHITSAYGSDIADVTTGTS